MNKKAVVTIGVSIVSAVAALGLTKKVVEVIKSKGTDEESEELA